MDPSDIDHNFEPQTRARSNTWPLRPNREVDSQSSPASEDSNTADGQIKAEKLDPLGLTAKKSGSRRNAWGNLSYADLITKAIQSSSEKRLTLSQIYDWMVQNVPYFKDKGDSTSSAGWKNSIRHNLSLHSRFMRIQNEGTGKSSWWVINPDAKPGKAPRRRAGSMETKSYEKKRGRIKKKVEALQAALENGGSPVTGSEDYLDNLGFVDFRPRAGSTASSCGGHLSPIHSGLEPDLHDNQVPPMSPLPYVAEAEDSQGMYNASDHYSELVDSLVVGMKLIPGDNLDMGSGMSADTYISSNGSSQEFNQPATYMNSNDPMGDSGQYPAPPPYPDCTPNSQQQQQQATLTNMDCALFPGETYPNLNCGMNGYRQSELQRMNGAAQLSINTQQPQLSSPDHSQHGSPSPQAFTPQRLSPQMQRTASQPSMPLNCQLSPQTRALASPVQRSSPSLQQAAMQQIETTASILRDVLTRGSFVQPLTTNTPFALGSLSPTTAAPSVNTNMVNLDLSPHHMHQHSPQHQHQLRISQPPANSYIIGTGSGCGGVANGPSTNFNNNTIIGGSNAPLDIDMEYLSSYDYDMEQVIKQELMLEGNLDFDNIVTAPSAAGQNIVH